eukprot:CAMPEP_0181127202 /NCGR_PEP_ID=MMETSP1071-20121207/28063_1 /TAXON_ID=35127 /ORGANISM="Thalassiosira sp., Strain NH16" /LENGTH=46 /DNA_ID= /DNA_START= /DNA_END= /DNA_ORIENTATION=
MNHSTEADTVVTEADTVVMEADTVVTAEAAMVATDGETGKMERLST